MTDRELYTEIKNGSLKAFDELFRRHYAGLCAFAAQIVPLSEAENIVQDIFMTIWEKRDGIVLRHSISTYLYTSVRHRCLTHNSRNSTKLKVYDMLYESMKDKVEDPDFIMVKELSAKLKEALDKLPESYRAAFMKHRFDDMTYNEIAASENISVKTVEYRISQALKLLRISLADYLPLLVFLLHI